jgi:predicted RNA-binding protein with PUA-like domain
MAHWLLKSEPVKYPWDRLVADGRTHWDGVRNYQAANNLKAMVPGEQAFFYHSNDGLEIVGIAEIVRAAYPDPGDAAGRFVMVDVAPVKQLPVPVTLQAIKANPHLSGFALVRQSRLSVVPVTEDEWKILLAMGGLKA